MSKLEELLKVCDRAIYFFKFGGEDEGRRYSKFVSEFNDPELVKALIEELLAARAVIRNPRRATDFSLEPAYDKARAATDKALESEHDQH
jgi:hypothetical protein